MTTTSRFVIFLIISSIWLSQESGLSIASNQQFCVYIKTIECCQDAW
uniref:Uncharacterized protein n=1 Tax=Arundo donax TaxID=35708 RepID=A0A0A9BDB6_ARUDO